MKGVNKVILVGTCGKDPESHTFPDGNMSTVVSLATSESWTDKKTGQKQERTEWHRLVFADRGNRKLGQVAAQYLKKGSKIYAEGSIKTKEWTDKTGNKRYSTEIVVNDFQFVGDPKKEQTAAPEQPQYQPPHGASPGQRSGPDPSQAPGQAAAADEFDFDDDIPF